jgi:hypothetical protein
MTHDQGRAPGAPAASDGTPSDQPNGWWLHVLHRAEELAAEHEEHAELPALVKAEHKRIRLEALRSRALFPPPATEEGSGSAEDQQTA